MKIKLPRYAKKFNSGKYRYRILWGGRGSGKSQTIATLLLLKGAERKLRILCLREIMESIADSSHKLLKDLIMDNPALSAFYTVTQSAIRGANGTEFIFKGLRYNVTEIKGTQGIDYAWVEEAANVSENSWQMLIPTIRQEDSEIWVSFNPEIEESATYRRFLISPPDNSIIMKVNFDDNPFFPAVLREEMENDKRRDYNQYLHIWEGELRQLSGAQVFKNFEVREFEAPSNAEFLYGCDWGFSNDPMVLLRCYIDGRKLYIDYEAYAAGIEIDDFEEFFDTVPDSKRHKIRADSARPELIAYMKGRGYKIESARKGAGSVEGGIDNIRRFDVVIHPRCKMTAREFSKYSYKTHRLTGDILPEVIDADNHAIDALRYALEPLLKLRKSIFA